MYLCIHYHKLVVVITRGIAHYFHKLMIIIIIIIIYIYIYIYMYIVYIYGKWKIDIYI